MRPQDIRQVLPSGRRQEMARRVPAVLALPPGSRRAGHLLQPGRQHLLQEGLLSVSERTASCLLLAVCRKRELVRDRFLFFFLVFQRGKLFSIGARARARACAINKQQSCSKSITEQVKY